VRQTPNTTSGNVNLPDIDESIDYAIRASVSQQVRIVCTGSTTVNIAGYGYIDQRGKAN
jgi:hypothetical protein